MARRAGESPPSGNRVAAFARHELGVSVTTGSNSQVFGKRKKQHIVILASGDNIRHMTIRPWMMALTVCFLGMM